MINRMNKYPSPDVSIIIGTFGSLEWSERGKWLADATYRTQLMAQVEVINVHADTLAEARNAGANEARAPWLVFLDADDLLDDYYCFSIANYEGTDKILLPSVRGFRSSNWTPIGGYANREFIEPEPVVPQRKELIKQNFLPIGAPITYHLFEFVGGFDDWPVLEDWAFWLACQETQWTKIGDLPEAVYWINDDHQRNQHPDIDNVARQIRAEYSE